MMTFFVGVLDFDTGKFTYSSAGHNPPWLFRHQDGGYKLISLASSAGLRLGEDHDLPPFEEKTIDFGKDDIFFLYTDGLMEGKNPEGEMYGKKRMRLVAEATVASGEDEMIRRLLKEFLAHNGNKPLDDDITLVAAKILARTSGGSFA